MSMVKAFVQLNHLPIWRREVSVWNRRITAPSLDRLVCLLLHRWGLMGCDDKRFFEAHIRPGMRVIDIGANQGLYATLFSRLVGDTGSVLAFEPDPTMFAMLEHNCRVNDIQNIACYPVALGNEKGTALLSQCLVHGGDNRLGRPHPDAISRTVEVPVTTLDEAVGNGPVDFVKIDVQGWEGAVLSGMERVMGSNPDLRIYFEYSPRSLAQAGTDPLKILNQLHERGFQLFHCHKGGTSIIEDFEGFRDSLHGRQYTNVYASRKPA